MVVEKVFAVIAESTRRDLLEALAQESKSVGQLVDELGVSQPTVSKHLRVLREAGVVTMRAQGQKRYYGISTAPLSLVSTWLESLGAGVVATAAAERNGADGGATAASSGELAAALAKSPPVAASVVAPAVAPLVVVPPAPASQLVSEKVSVTAAAAHQAEPSAASQTTTDQAPAAAAAAAAADTSAHASSNGTAAVVPFGSVRSGVMEANENAAGTPGQFSRSVGNAGRLANKAADLLSNLPALPTFKRRKN